MDYWQRRNVRAQEAVSDKSIKEIEKQLAGYYRGTAKRVMRDFEATYDKLLATVAAGRTPTPADLYKLDKYWQMQGQLQRELQKLGDQSIEALQKAFVKQYIGVYNSVAIPGGAHYATVSRETALQMINAVWCADGKAWSARVWANTARLQETLNENLVHCVVTGKKPTELKNLLQERFNVSYSQADTLVRTETAHIQTQAAQKRYEDYGITEYEFLGREEHDIGCACKKLDGKRFKLIEMREGVNAPPMHPNCRCAIAPIVEID